MRAKDRLTKGARVVVRIAWTANRAFLVAVMLGLIWSFVSSAQFEGVVGRMLPGTDVPSAMAGARWTMLLGIVMSLVTDRLLLTLTDIVASAEKGDPFVTANTRRLQAIGWCLLALQLCEIPGILIAKYFPAMRSAAPSGDISIGGWIAVLMVFVLARVFAAGSAMRDDLEGTV